MQITPYLDFPGTCAEAMRFYERVLGGRNLVMMTMGDGPMAEHTPPERHHRIMHARMSIGDGLLMASDTPDEAGKADRVTVNIGLDDPAEAERVFAALSEGGTVEMPIQQTFWATRFGMMTDRFGIKWMVNCEVAMERHAEAA